MNADACAIELPTLWVISPVYLDVVSYLRLREDLQREATELAIAEVRFVVIDDSAGRDLEIGRLRLLGDVIVLEPPFNLGHQRAIVFGARIMADEMRAMDLVVTLDADGEDRPEDLPRLLTPLFAAADDAHQVTLALRTRRRESALFKAFYLAFRLFFRILTGKSVRTGNYAAFRGWTAQQAMRHPHFDLCYSSTFVALGLATKLVPCERGTRYAGRSRMGVSGLIMHGLRMLMPFTDRIALRALLTFSLTMALSVALSLVVIAVRLFSDAAIPGWATFTLLGLLVLSLVAVGNFVVLFAVFSQSRGISLANLEQGTHGSTGTAPPPSARTLA